MSLSAHQVALLGVVGRQVAALQQQLDAVTALFVALHAELVPEAPDPSPATAAASAPVLEDVAAGDAYPKVFGRAEAPA